MSRAMSSISTFSSGELDPRMRGRTDLKHYQQGALRMRNFRQLAQGGVSTRPGTDLVSQLQSDGRLIPFIFSEDQSYLLAFTPNRISVFGSPGASLSAFGLSSFGSFGGFSLSGLSSAAPQGWDLIQEITTPYTLDQCKSLDFTQFADTMIICHERQPPMVLKRFTGPDFQLSVVEFDFNENRGRHNQPYHKFTAPQVHLKFFHAGGAYTALLNVTCGVYSNNSTDPVLDFWNVDHIGKRFQIIDAGDSNKFKEFVVVSLDANGYDAVVTLVQGFSTATAALTLDWGEPLYSNLRGFPATACFREGRLWFAGSPSRPSGIIASKIEQFFNFDVGTGLADDAIDFTCATSEVRKIEYIIPGRDLTYMCDGAELYTSVDEGEAITPSNMNVKPQTFFGCKRVKPHVFDNAITFAQRGNGRNIREYHYKDVNQSYTSSSISILAGHLIQNPIDSAVLTSADFPEQYLFYVMENGSMAVFHSIREEESRGWSLWFPGTSDSGWDSNTTTYNNSTTTSSSQNEFSSSLELFSSMTAGDKYLSVAVVNDDLFALVRRKVGEETKFFIERFNVDRYFDCATTIKPNLPEPTFNESSVFFTPSVTASQTPTGPTRQFLGLTAYSGQKVAVRVRNIFLGLFDVSWRGVLTLPDTVEAQIQIDVGLPFLAYLQPMPFDAATRQGALSGKKRRLSRLIVDTHDTLSLTANDQVLLTRDVKTNVSSQPKPTTGPYEFNFLGYSRDPTVTLVLTEPMKATILSMQAELAY